MTRPTATRVISTAAFYAVMGLAAAISLVRGVAVAAIVSPYEFGLYATLVAVGALLSSVLGLGEIEATMKKFPRQWARGKSAEVCVSADRIAASIGRRAAVVTTLTLPVAIFADDLGTATYVVAVAAVATSTAGVALYASALRASRDLRSLAHSTLLRAGVALGAATAGAHVAGWALAIAGEILGAIIGAAHTRRATMRLAAPSMVAGPPEKQIDESTTILDSRGGSWLLIATLLSTSPFYLDRVFVSSQFGPAAAGTYALAMLLVTASSTLTGISAQKVGPTLASFPESGSIGAIQHAYVWRWVGGQTAAVIVASAAAWWLITYGPLASIAVRYELTSMIFAGAVFLAILQVTPLWDWLLLSRNRERAVFVAATIYAFGVVIACTIAVWCAWSLTEWIFGLAIAKLCHLAAQLTLVHATAPKAMRP